MNSSHRLVTIVAGLLSACVPRAEAPVASSVVQAAEASPEQALAALDPRRPVPLQPMMAWHQKQNMMDHLAAVQRIVGAVAEEDWAEIARASARIESSPAMRSMCQHMGAGAEGFTELALEFHRRADGIGSAARAEDRTAVLRATAHTLDACTTCHAQYRQELVDAATFAARTGQAHSPGAH